MHPPQLWNSRKNKRNSITQSNDLPPSVSQEDERRSWFFTRLVIDSSFERAGDASVFSSLFRSSKICRFLSIVASLEAPKRNVTWRFTWEPYAKVCDWFEHLLDFVEEIFPPIISKKNIIIILVYRNDNII